MKGFTSVFNLSRKEVEDQVFQNKIRNGDEQAQINVLFLYAFDQPLSKTDPSNGKPAQ